MDTSVRQGTQIPALALYREIFKLSGIGMGIYDPSGRCIEVNEALCRLVGADREHLLALNYYNLQSWKESGLLAAARSAFEDQKETMSQVTLTSSFGRRITMDYQVVPVSDAGKRYMLLIANDITEKKQAEIKLREAEEKYRSFFEHAPLGIVHLDTKGVVTAANKMLVESLGTTMQKVIGFDTRQFLADEKMKDAVFSALAGEQAFYEGYYSPVTGSVALFISGVYSPIRSKDGEITGALGFFADISSQKKAEKALRENEARYQQLLDTMSHGVQLNDCQGTITYSNSAHHVIAGYPDGELLGMKIWDMLSSPEEKKKLKKYLAVLVSEQPSPEPYFTGSMTRKDGTPVDIQIDWDYVRNEDGVLTGFISVITDITEQKRVEAALRKANDELEQRVLERTVLLERKTVSLGETNIALKRLLQQREEDKKELAEKVMFDVEKLVLPYLEKLKMENSGYADSPYLEVIEKNLREIASPFSRNSRYHLAKLTPAQMQIANLIAQGRTTKEIAGILKLSPETIATHRQDIRKRLGLTKNGANLRSFLNTLENDQIY